MKKKATIVVLAFSLVLCFAIGGSLAWLVDDTKKVTNTFSTSDINIELAETTSNYKMVPGNTIAKDPTVTVEANSEACWLFVKVEKSANFDDFMTYGIADGWTQLTKDAQGNTITDLIYFREVAASDSDQNFTVLANNNVTVKTNVTKEMMNGLTDETMPTLTFTAYAVQKANITTATEAWEIAIDSTNSPTT